MLFRSALAQTNERLFEGLDFRFATPGARALGMGVTFVGLAAGEIVPSGRRRAGAALIAGVLPVFLPFQHFITTSAVADTFGLLPWWWVQDHWLSLGHVRWAALGVALAAAALAVVVPRRHALALVGLVAAYFVLMAAVVENGRHGMRQASLGKLWAGIRVAQPDWIDRAVGRDASVTILRTSTMTDETIWQNEFFNRSVRSVVAYGVTRVPDPLPERMLARDRSGSLGVRAAYVLGEDVIGTVVARDPGIGVSLYRVDGPLVVATTHVEGLYPNDTWSGASVTYVRSHCAGGTLTVLLGSDASLYRGDQVVVAHIGGEVAGRAIVPPDRTTQLVVPLRSTNGRCSVRFEVERTLVPGGGDQRELGAHFLGFTYTA